MIQKSVGDAEIAFGVFKVDRIDLVRHRGAADFAFLELLLEEAHGDVAPDVAVEVDENRVGAFDLVEEFGHVVVRFDLDGVRVEGHAQAFFDHALAVSFPVVVGVGDEMGVEVTHGAVHLGVELDGFDRFDDAGQTHGDVGHFLADRRRTGSLAVRARKHRNGGPAVRKFTDVIADGGEAFHESLAACGEHQRMARVVDVFARASEVHEFGGLGKFFVVSDLFLDPVFHGLDVVVGAGFDRLDFFAVAFREVVGQAAQECLTVCADRSEFFKTGFRQSDQPFDFNAHAGVHESRFGENAAQDFTLTGITTVKRTQGGKRGKCLHRCLNKRKEAQKE
jgi:predicted RNA-binding protein